MNISQRYFERFCQRRGIAFKRLPEGRAKTPDYEIYVDGAVIAAEVKQIQPNDADKAILGDVAAGKATSFFLNRSRARASIHHGVKQLRAHSDSRRPGIVVLFELAPLLGYLDAECIAQCLYGPERFHVDVPDDRAQNPMILDVTR